LFVTDYLNNRIQQWVSNASSGTTVAGQSNGASGASSTLLNNPVGIAIDTSNNVYFTDRNNHRAMSWLNGASSGTVIAGITGKHKHIRRTARNACLTRVYLLGSAGTALNQLNYPSGIVRESSTGTLYISDTSNHRIVRYLSGASSGTVVAGGNGAGIGSTQLWNPYGFTLDSSSNSLIIVNYNAHNVVRWVLGATSWTLLAGSNSGISGNTALLMNNPLSVVLDSSGNMYVSDTTNHRIQMCLAGQSNATTIAGTTGSARSSATELNLPFWAIIDTQLNLYVADTYNHRVQRFSRY
jgi:sugar lactone lactonase YvrE